ncbi:MAG: PQQ-dependent sugar dehydrogenase [Candidatus Sungbacteria bacterium]|nr:PQQ-dependent sugar dehydrogenase [Candidatus Sungbacteria bacterium]
MKKFSILVIAVCFLLALIWAGTFYWKNLRGVGPVLNDPPVDIADIIPDVSTTTPSASPGENTTGMPLKLPPGFSISIFAKNLSGARVMAFDSFGNMWVSRTSEGKITMLEVRDGKVVRQNDVFSGLRKPHGLAMEPGLAAGQNVLYYAEENKVSRVTLYSDAKPAKITDLPAGGGHFTRTLGFGPDGRLYVSIGSSCNVCRESDARRAAIYSLNKDGSDFKLFAKGLRNSVFFAWHPETKKMWATEMGRDLIGDDIPPDEVNIIEEDPSTALGVKNYGWPTCYGKNVHDTDFDHNTYIRNPCMEPFETQSFVDVPAHSAPLGLVFVPDMGWPTEYRNSLLVAYHGSWNRSIPTGYKVVRMKFDSEGSYQGTEDFITGWLVSKNEALGRPVDILALPDGTAYISDDKAGVIYKITAPR